MNWQTVKECYEILYEWPEIPALNALELLNHKYKDKYIRSYAVKQLHTINDEELSDILLQLVQVDVYSLY
jgi:hypothetical protein